MPAEQTLSIKTATIEIKVVRVDGHKMTKATFRQIPTDNEIVIEKDKQVLGWVNENGNTVILFTHDNKIWRRTICRWAGHDCYGDAKYTGTSVEAQYHMNSGVAWEYGEICRKEFDQLFIAT